MFIIQSDIILNAGEVMGECAGGVEIISCGRDCEFEIGEWRLGACEFGFMLGGSCCLMASLRQGVDGRGDVSVVRPIIYFANWCARICLKSIVGWKKDMGAGLRIWRLGALFSNMLRGFDGHG